MTIRVFALWSAIAFSIAAVDNAFACAACGCTLNTDLGSQGLVSGGGWRMDFRYDFVDQDQLRTGTGAASIATPAPFEVEQRTENAYYTLGIDYGFNRRWGVNVQLPFLDRYHTTIAEGDTDVSSSHSRTLSDARVLGRYTGFSPDMSTGLLFGLKLPTGRHDVNFAGGPAAGTPLDRSLQPGTGTTDLLLGAYHFDDFNQYTGWFVQAQYQHALGLSEDYAQGDSYNLNLGARYYWRQALTPQLQLNVQDRERDRGAQADPDNTGGRLVYVSPGITFAAGAGWSGFAFVQFPVYQRVNGLQLAPRQILTAGASYAL